MFENFYFYYQVICFLLCVIFKCSVPIGVFPQWDLDCFSMTGIKYLPKATWRMKKFIWLSGYSPAPRKQGRSLLRQRPQLWHGWGLSLSLWLPLAIILFLSISPVFPTPHPIQSSQFSSFSTGWRNTCSVLLGLQCLGSWHRIKKNLPLSML